MTQLELVRNQRCRAELGQGVHNVSGGVRLQGWVGQSEQLRAREQGAAADGARRRLHGDGLTCNGRSDEWRKSTRSRGTTLDQSRA